MTQSAEREEEEQPDDEPGAMCAQGHRGSRCSAEGDGRTVTCCLFGEWDLRARSAHGAQRKEGGEPRRAGLDDELAGAAHALLKRLNERSLDALVKAVEARGSGECVMVTSTELRLGGHQVPAQHLLCRMYRWSDLAPSARLKTLSHCQSFGAPASSQVCCNPHHYSRLCGPGKARGAGRGGKGLNAHTRMSPGAHVGLPAEAPRGPGPGVRWRASRGRERASSEL